MSAPYIIPFNHQPVNTGRTTSTYTVPSGKYARVHVKNLMLPTLNGSALYTSYSPAVPIHTTSVATQHIRPCKKAHRISFSQPNGGVNNYISFSPIGTVSSTNYALLFTTSGSLILSGADIDGFYNVITTGGNSGAVSITIDYYDGPDYVWLKAADAIAFSEGVLFYEEYNVIS